MLGDFVTSDTRGLSVAGLGRFAAALAPVALANFRFCIIEGPAIVKCLRRMDPRVVYVSCEARWKGNISRPVRNFMRRVLHT